MTRFMTRLLTGLLALSLAFMPGESWAPTQVAPVGGGAVIQPTSTPTGYGQQWFVSTSPFGGSCTEWVADNVLVGYQAPTTTSFQTFHSNNGGISWDTGQTITGFPGSTFGQMTACFKASNGRYFFMMSGINGGFNTAINPSGGVSGWAINPVGDGIHTGKSANQGSNGTIVVIREDLGGNNTQACRSTNGGLTFTCVTVPGSSGAFTNSLWSPSSGVWIYASGNGGGGAIMRSTDDGQSFNIIFTPAGGFNGMFCYPNSQICLMAAGGIGASSIQRSTDGGVTWSGVYSIVPATWGTATGAIVNTVGWANFGGGVIDVLRGTVTSAGLQSAGYRSTDFGLTWVPLPFYTLLPGGINVNGIYAGVTGSVSVRGGRAYAGNATDTAFANLYSPAISSGATLVQDNQGNTLKAGAGCGGSNPNVTVFTNISTAASAQLITGTAGTRTIICLVNVFATGGANNVALVEGTGATCGTGILGLFGGATAATGWGLAANGSQSLGNGRDMVRRTAVDGDNICLLVSAATQVSGLLVTVNESQIQ